MSTIREGDKVTFQGDPTTYTAHEIGWTAARDSILRRCAETGKSFTQAAAKLGVSRNSIAGRAHRLGVQFRGGSK